MNKLQLIEMVQIRLGGGSASADIKEKYRAGVINLVLGGIFNDMLVRVFQYSPNPSISNLDAYTKPYLVSTIHAADDTNMKYVEIPTSNHKLLQLPNNQAIRHCFTTEITPRECIYRDIGQTAVYSQLDVNREISNPRMMVMGKNIYFDSRIDPATGVLLYLVVPWSEYSETEDLPAPLENNEMVIQEAYNIMLNNPPDDSIYDDKAVQV